MYGFAVTYDSDVQITVCTNHKENLRKAVTSLTLSGVLVRLDKNQGFVIPNECEVSLQNNAKIFPPQQVRGQDDNRNFSSYFTMFSGQENFKH